MGLIDEWNKRSDSAPQQTRSAPPQTQVQPQQSQPQKKKARGGIVGLAENIARGAAEPFSYLANTAIVNPAKEIAAQVTGNKVAARNANRESNIEIGLGEHGTDIANAAKKWAGNSAQALIAGATPEINTIRKGAAIGGATGASAALAQEDSTAEDVLAGGVMGGATGGVLSGAGKILGKLTKGSKSLATSGKALDAEASGIGIGQTLKGGRMVTPEYEAELQDFMRNGSKEYVEGGVRAGKPRSQATSAQEVFNGVKKKLNSTLDDINREVGEGDRLKIGSDVTSRVQDDAGITGTTKTWEKFETKVNKAKDLKELEAIRKEADDIAYSSDKAGKTSAARQARHVRDAIDDYITPESTDYKTVKSHYQLAKDALELTSKGTKNAEGGRVPGVGIKGGKQVLAGAKSKTGNFIERMTSRVPSTESLPDAVVQGGNFLNRMTRQGITSQAGAGVVPEPDQPLDTMQPQPEAPANPILEGTVLEPGRQEVGSGVEGADPNDPFNPANVQANTQKILSQGGTMKDVAEYLNNVETMQKLTGGGQKKPLNSTAAGVVTDLQNGIANIRGLKDEYASSDANNPLTSWFRGRNPYDTSAQDLQAKTARIKQVIGKALEGGVLRKEDEEKYAKILPMLNNTDAVAQNRIDDIANDLERKLQLYVSNLGGGSGGADLASLGI